MKYYVQTDLNDDDYKKRIVIQIEDSIYYSIYPDRINKRSKHHINLGYTLYYGKVPSENSEPKTFQKLVSQWKPSEKLFSRRDLLKAFQNVESQ